MVVGINLLATAKALLNEQHDALPMMLFVIALGAARLAALVATWRWKRWGIYLWFVCATVGAYIYASYATNPGLAFITVIGAVVFFLCFWSRWDEFE